MRCLRPSGKLKAFVLGCWQDFGRNWQNLTDNSQGRIAAFVDFDWGAELYRWGEDHDEIRDKTIFATAYEDAR